MPPRTKRRGAATARARRYGAAGPDQLLNLHAIEIDFGLATWAFIQRQKRGWVSLGGGRLAPQTCYFARTAGGPASYPEACYRRADVEAAVRPLPRDSGYTLVPDGKGGTIRADGKGRYVMPDGRVLLSFERARRQLGRGRRPLARETLDRLATAGVVRFEWWNSPLTRYREQVCPESEVIAVAQKRGATPPAEQEQAGVVYLPRKAAMKALDVSSPTLTRWATSCPYLKGRPVGTLSVPTTRGGPETWYAKADVLEVTAALKATAAGVYRINGDEYLSERAANDEFTIDPSTLDRLFAEGRVKAEPRPPGPGRPGRVYRREDLRAYLRDRGQKFDGVYDVPGKGRGFNLARAALASGLKVPFLKKHLARSPHFPEGRLPAVKMAPPAVRGRSQRENVILEADLDRLRAALAAADRAARRRPPGMLKAPEIAARMGYAKEQAVALGAVLKFARTSGGLAAELAWAPRKQGGRRRVWFYDFNRFREVVGDSDICKLAEELRQCGAAVVGSQASEGTVTAPSEAGTMGTGGAADAAELPQAQAPRPRRGRRKGSIDQTAAARNRDMRADWAAKRFSSVAELARHYHVSRPHASAILKGGQ